MGEPERDRLYVAMEPEPFEPEELIPGDDELAETAEHPGEDFAGCVLLESEAAPGVRALTVSGNGATKAGHISLRFIVVIVRNPRNGKWSKVAGLLDDGSNVSLMSEKLKNTLGFTGDVRAISIGGLGGKTISHEACHTWAVIEHTNQKIKINAQLKCIPSPVGTLTMTDWATIKKDWPHLSTVPFHNMPTDPAIHLLLGNDLNFLHRSLKEVHPPKGVPGPSARLTPMGWTATGRTSPGGPPGAQRMEAHLCSNSPLMASHSAKQELHPRADNKLATVLNYEDRRALKMLQENTKQLKDGSYEAPVVWKGAERPGYNAIEAMKDWLKQYAKLKHKPEAHQQLSKIILGWQEKGYIREVPRDEPRPRACFHLVHFPVIREDNKTTKIRPVMNGKASFNGQSSLNDCLSAGPRVMNDLAQVLWHFRRFQVALGADIQEMFLRIKMPPEDWPFHRFFFTIFGKNYVSEFEAMVHQFGSKSSPFVSIFTVKKHAVKKEPELPVASKIVLKHSIVDDLLKSFRDNQETIRAILQLLQLFALCNMTIHKWVCNRPEVLHQAGVNGSTKPKLIAEPEQGPQERALGLKWDSGDLLSFSIGSKPEVWTRRTALSVCNSLFDPHGYLLPFKMTGRLLFKALCLSKLPWDDALAQDAAREWDKYWAECQKACEIKLPRWLQGETATELHVFGDSSGLAYACCAYLSGPNETLLVGAKGHIIKRVALTIPKGELESGALAADFGTMLRGIFEIPAESTYYWLDCKPALHWIKSPGRDLDATVARRAAHIREITNPAQWNHVPTELNPADLPSRGISADKLAKSSLWWHGPPFLQTQEWPRQTIPTEPTVELPGEDELGRIVCLGQVDQVLNRDPFTNASTFSQGARVVRVLLSKIRGTRVPLEDAFKAWRIFDQKLWFTKIIKKLQTKPQIHFSGVLLTVVEGELVMTGRIRAAPRPLLHKDSRLSLLWVKHCHEEELRHIGGHKTLAAQCRETIWIWQGSGLFRRITNGCIRCRRTFPHPRPQAMAPLPPQRFQSQPLTVFAHTSLDYAGPWHTVQGRGKVRSPRFLLLFCCMASRACALEMTYGETTDDTLMALQCFASRYRLPELIYSDNAAPLVAAGEFMNNLRENRSDLPLNRAWNNVKWRFSTPRASHTNGITESLIKSSKHAIRRTLHSAVLRDGMLRCVFAYVEDMLNQRPIAQLNNDPRDPDTLTPAKLMGRTQGPVAPDTDTRFRLANKWRETNMLAQEFWRQFQREIVPEMEKAQKWWNVVPAPQPGDAVVVLKLDPHQGGDWPVGVVQEVHVGRDGLVRSATVLVRGTLYQRSLKHLMPLA